MHQKSFGRVKSPLGPEKSPLGREKSPAPLLKGIPTSFPILVGEIQMTMPGPNALHWPQSKI